MAAKIVKFENQIQGFYLFFYHATIFYIIRYYEETPKMFIFVLTCNTVVTGVNLFVIL